MPFPVQPNPRTWSANDIVTVPRLRADVSNLAWLLTKRPTFVAQSATGYSISQNTITGLIMDTQFLDNWNGGIGGAAAQPVYTAQLPGWYLCDGDLAWASGTASGTYAAGIEIIQNSVSSDLFGQVLISNAVNPPCPGASDLVQMDPATGDTLSMFAYQTTAGPVSTGSACYFKAEWVALPTSTFTDGVTGTVVSNPVPAALWPPGAGTQITNVGGIGAGATSMTVTSATGIVVNGTLGLDWYEGTAMVPTAETVTVSSVAGTTIGISATTYPHGGTATPGYVAVPVSAAWMNQQVRDTVRFLAYPPVLRAKATTGQSLPALTFPAATPVALAATTVDNFSGFSSNQYIFPVAGLYYVYGCVPFPSGAANSYHVGISINAGTVQWGDSVRNNSAGVPASATVRKHIRVAKGDALTLQVSVSTTGVTTTNSSNAYSVLIVVFRGF